MKPLSNNLVVNCKLFIIGDLWQLGPVKDNTLYADNILNCTGNGIKQQGKYVWDNIEKAILLKTIHRQSDERFTSLLDNISKGNITDDD
jgi:hypothetical protein